MSEWFETDLTVRPISGSSRQEVEIKTRNAAGTEATEHVEFEGHYAQTPREAARAIKAILKTAPTAGIGKIHDVGDPEARGGR